MFLKYLITGCFFLSLVGGTSTDAAPQGFLEARVKIVPSRPPVQRADENTASAAAQDSRDYPLIILSRAERKQIARITADGSGNYRAALPPGDYILDVEGRVAQRLRVRAQPFTVVANETVHVDMTITTGFAAEGTAPQE